MLEDIALTGMVVFTLATGLLIGSQMGTDVTNTLKYQRMLRNMPNYKFVTPGVLSAEWFFLISMHRYTKFAVGFCGTMAFSFMFFLDTSNFVEGILYANAWFWGFAGGRGIALSGSKINLDDTDLWEYVGDEWNRPLAITAYDPTTAKVRTDMYPEGSYFYLLIMAGHTWNKGVDGLYTFRTSTPVFDEDRHPIMTSRAGINIAVDNIIAKEIYSFMSNVTHQGIISETMVKHGLDQMSTPFAGVIHIPTIGSSVDTSWGNVRQLITYNDCAESDVCPCLWYQNWRTEFLRDNRPVVRY